MRSEISGPQALPGPRGRLRRSRDTRATIVIDRELVTRKMVLIAEDLPHVEALARKPVADYVASPTDEVLAERYLERMIGRMIDINYHLLTESGAPPPRDYFDSFVALGSAGVLPHLNR